MLALLLAATLDIGIYYTFPALNIETDIKEMLKQAQNLINKEAFGKRGAVELKPKFIRYWHIENPPIYRYENIFYAIDLDKILPDFIALTNIKANQ